MLTSSFVRRSAFFFFLIIPLTAAVLSHAQSSSSPPSGIAKLFDLSRNPIHGQLSSNTRALLTSTEQESFLRELEGLAPNWSLLHDQPGEENGERLFGFNRARDDAREGHTLLRQRIAFLWAGILRKYVPEYQGFTVAMGPESTPTHWGMVRFKPMGLPDEMIAVPSPTLRISLQKQLDQGEQIEIKILFIGKLTQAESVMYAFSHDHSGQGMIMPVVQTEGVRYFINLSNR